MFGRVGQGLVWMAMGVAMAAALVLFNDGRRPPSQAELEEARIFGADDAQWFGEEPETEVSLRLMSLPRDSAETAATVSLDGRTLQVRRGDVLLPPCVRVAGLLDDALLLDKCGSFSLLAQGQPAIAIQLPEVPEFGVSRGIENLRVVDLRNRHAATQLMQDYRQKLLEKPLSLRGQIEVDVKDGRRGEREFYLYPGKDKRLFTDLPLRSGDQITAINGTALSSREALSDLYRQLSEDRYVAVTLVRDQQPLVLLLGL